MANDQQKIQLAVIAGAAEALDYKDKNPKESNERAIQHVTSKVREIIRKIDKQDF
jgi:hypothetical protein